MKGIVFTPRPNAMESYEVKDFGEPLYQTIRDRIGGYMEVVRLTGSPYVFLVDEDGLNKDLEINAFASALAGTLIVGTVVLMKIGGEWRGIWQTPEMNKPVPDALAALTPHWIRLLLPPHLATPATR